MTTETTVFVLTILLGFGHIAVMAVLNIPEYGFSRLLGARDNLPPSNNVHIGRAWRANENFKETAPWALATLVLVQVTGDANAVTAAGAWLYLVSRLAFVPLYLLGVHTVRTLAWTGALIGISLMVSQLL